MADEQDYPIIMSGPMVRALLREIAAPGTGKTQTRRLRYTSSSHRRLNAITPDRGHTWLIPTPWEHLKPGRRLWVRETWSTDSAGERIYAADPFDDVEYKGDYVWGWKGGRYMPEAASRITLTLTDVRTENLTAITEQDCIAEGLERLPDKRWGVRPLAVTYEPTPRAAYAALWNDLHPTQTWIDDPEVVVLTFTVAPR